MFPTYECVGWYAIGSELTKEHQQRHQQVSALRLPYVSPSFTLLGLQFNVHLGLGQSSSLVFLLFDGDRNASLSGSGLPLRLYETSSGSVSSSTSGLKETPIAIKTDEPERIGIDTAVKSQSFSASGSNQSSSVYLFQRLVYSFFKSNSPSRTSDAASAFACQRSPHAPWTRYPPVIFCRCHGAW